MNFAEAFEIKAGAVIALTGGGGKTSLMFTLAKELSPSCFVVTTTTTKIFLPSQSDNPKVLIERDQSILLGKLLSERGKTGHITVATERLAAEAKLKGVDPSFIDQLHTTSGVDVIVVEADGAKGHSLKFPGANEPVVPSSTSMLIPVVGIDIVGEPLSDDTVFRLHLAPEEFRRCIGTPITTQMAAAIVTHPLGICKNTPKSAKIVPFINKVETNDQEDLADELAGFLRGNSQFRIERVIIGSTHVGNLRRNS